MNDQQWYEVHAIFDDRGVSREVAEARPYIPYRRGDDWVFADDGPYAVIPIEQRRATVMQDVRAADGLVMMKHPVPLKDRKLAEFPPQLRPTSDPGTGSIVNHDHRDPWITNLADHVADRHDGVDVDGLHDNYRVQLHDHDVEYGKVGPRGRISIAREEHVKGREHHGVDVDGLHEVGEPGKYKLAPTPLTDTHSFHAHPVSSKNCRHEPRCEDDDEHTEKHIAKHHVPPVPDGVHGHRWRVKNQKADSYAKRIDVHPMAIPLLEDAEVVLISMEGNLKADAMLTYILRHELPWSVVDIPSVGQWRCEELDDFATEHLTGRRTILVCDSDYLDRYDVQRQAFAFREYLRRKLGKHAVQVAAPPPSDEFEDCSRRHGDCPNPEPKKTGADDFVGKLGGRLEDLVVVERDVAPKLREWSEAYVKRYDRSGPNPYRSTARLAALMTLITKDDGRGRSSISSLSSFSSMHRTTVSHAITALHAPLGEPVEPFEMLRRRPPKQGYRQLQKFEADFSAHRYVDEQDQLEWVVRDGYRYRERLPRRTLEQVL
jgi:hypothetical protein